MRTEKKENRVIVFLEGRIDSVNSETLRRELEETTTGNPGRELVLDADALEYISSAGLRVLLQIRKQQGSMTILNVTPQVYDILEMTGFTDLLDVKKKMREFSVEGCEIIGRGAIGTVYRVDEDTIVKVYEIPDSLPMIENEQRRAKQAFLKGIPTAISYDVVRVGEKFGSVFELLRAETCNDLLIREPNRLDEIVRDYTYFIRGIHAVEMEPGEVPAARDIFLGYLEELRSILPEEMYARLCALFRAMPENLHVVHGDMQMKNVMISGGELILIDMDTLCAGDPVFDLQSAYVAYVLFNEDDPENSEKFFGLSKETCAAIWKKMMEYYFDYRGDGVLSEDEKRIRVVASVRFLYLLQELRLGDPELTDLRVRHTLEHLRELLPRVDGLEVAPPDFG